MERVMKVMCWIIVITGWVLYGLIILVTTMHPPKHEPNPAETMQFLFSKSEWSDHWRFHLLILSAIILYFSAWGFLQSQKEEKDERNIRSQDGKKRLDHD